MSARYLWLLPLALAAGGCNKSDLGIVPVAGTVTLDGKPLDGATVFFSPADATKMVAPSSFGKTGPDGRYTLAAAGTREAGAVSGTHRVTVSKGQPGYVPKGDEAVPETLPAQYNQKSKLLFDVPAGGTAAADFALTSK
jgi:hypothetical protein